MKKYTKKMGGAVALGMLSVVTTLLIFGAVSIMLDPFVKLFSLRLSALMMFVIWAIVYLFSVISIAVYCEAKPAEVKARKRRR